MHADHGCIKPTESADDGDELHCYVCRLPIRNHGTQNIRASAGGTGSNLLAASIIADGKAATIAIQLIHTAIFGKLLALS